MLHVGVQTQCNIETSHECEALPGPCVTLVQLVEMPSACKSAVSCLVTAAQASKVAQPLTLHINTG